MHDDDPTGRGRRRKRDRGKALAGKSTLNRLELTPTGANPSHRYNKTPLPMAKTKRLLVSFFLDDHERSLGKPK